MSSSPLSQVVLTKWPGHNRQKAAINKPRPGFHVHTELGAILLFSYLEGWLGTDIDPLALLACEWGLGVKKLYF